MEVPSIFLNKLLAETAKKSANSLHLSVGSPPMIRIDGELSYMEGENIISLEMLKKIVDSFLDDKEKKKLESERELIVVKSFSGNFRFRVNIFFQKNMPAISFNFISNKIINWSNFDLSFNFKKLINSESGLIVVAGSNDSGKTSTIASMLEEINSNQKKYIITLEKPIEYMFVNKKSIIEQREVGRDVSSLLNGLKHCLEEDVDIVYVNERDEEFENVIPLIIELAQGNSLVLLELNAENSVRIVEKILGALKTKMSKVTAMHNVADVLLGAISQKLLPSIGGGISMASEVMIVNPAIRSLIRDEKIYQINSIIQTSRQEGMNSLDKSIEELVKNGKVSQGTVDKIQKEFEVY